MNPDTLLVYTLDTH